jgi:hypothetical protein
VGPPQRGGTVATVAQQQLQPHVPMATQNGFHGNVVSNGVHGNGGTTADIPMIDEEDVSTNLNIENTP